MDTRAGWLDWWFRNRRTGRITLAQTPNLPLALWLLMSVALWLGPVTGRARDVLGIASSAALAWWAADEVLRGVNPFRRLLGAVVLAWLVTSLARAT